MTTAIEAAVRHTVVAEYRPLLRYAKRLTSNDHDAADLVHAAMLRALASCERASVPNNLSAWLRTVLFRLFVDQRRRAARESQARLSLLHEPEEYADPPPSWTRLTVEDVRESVSRLPSHFREPYELFVFKHLTYLEIAALLNLPATTVGTRIKRARLRLRGLLQERCGGSYENAVACGV